MDEMYIQWQESMEACETGEEFGDWLHNKLTDAADFYKDGE